MNLKIKSTEVFADLIKTNKRFVLSVGSSRSSKTYSMMQWIIYYCLQNQNASKYISIVRKSFPSLRRTVYREFIDMLKEYKIYDERKHNKTEHKVDVFGNWVEFFSLNDSQKIRGAKRDILYLNEVNEIDYESAQQLFLRTSERVFMDENPSDVWHWSMKYQNRDDCDYIHCFPGYVKVLTESGYQRIDTIKVGDKVMTRKGLKKVTKVYDNGLSYVNTYKIGDRTIDVTPGHKFWSEEYGFKEIFLLPSKATFSTYDHINDIWSNQKLNITELSSQNTHQRNTLSLVAKLLEANLLDYIDISGQLKEGQYQKDMKSITSMVINSTIGLKTYNVLQNKNIEKRHLMKCQKSLIKKGLCLSNQKKVKKRFQNGSKRQTQLLLDKRYARVVKKLIKQLYTQIKNTVHQDVMVENQCRDNVKKLEKENVNTANQYLMRLDQKLNIVQKNVKVPVFDLEVEDEHEYVVDGLLVSNSTYKKNPFLTKAQVAQIESYKDKDENFHRVYALGLPGYAITTIYTHYDFFDEVEYYDDYCYGLDVGYGHAMALVKCYYKDDQVWVEEIIYKSGLTSSDLIKIMKDLNIDEYKYIWVDAAAPSMIEDLKRAGFNAKSADKSVKEGIDLIKSKKIYINNNSSNLIDELKRYSWKTKGEQIIYEPVKVNDDLCDAMRYCIWNHYKNHSISDWSLLF